MSELTDDQIAAEEEFLKGLPRFNVGAFFMPPIWGPVHGFWITVLFYPAWLLVDNLLYALYCEFSVLNVVLAVSAVVIILALSAVFSIVSQPMAAHRAENKGISRERYLRNQRIWAVVCIVLAVAMVVFASIYNINIRPYV